MMWGERRLLGTTEELMRVYHFLEAKWAQYDLQHRRLKISRFDELNDPFELLAADLRDRTTRRAFVALRDHMCAKRGVLCFSRNWSNPLLWSHYADRHRGVCLGFDVPDGYANEVRYDTNRMLGVVENITRRGVAAEAMVNRLLLTKYNDWNYEDEVRVFTDLSDRDETTGLFFKDFGPDLRLAEIIFGPRHSEQAAQLAALARSIDTRVKLVQGRLAFRTFRVVPNLRYTPAKLLRSADASNESNGLSIPPRF